jgi:hypothetical protein
LPQGRPDAAADRSPPFPADHGFHRAAAMLARRYDPDVRLVLLRSEVDREALRRRLTLHAG